MPMPSGVDGGSVVDSVTLTVPVVDALNWDITVPPGASVAVNVVVPAVGAVDEGVVVLLLLPHPAAASVDMTTNARPSDRLMRLLQSY